MSVPRITKEVLKTRLEEDAANAPVILDVRLKYPYEHSTMTLPGAVRVDPDAVDTSEPVPRARHRRLRFRPRGAGERARRGGADSPGIPGERAGEGGLPDWITAKYPTDTKDAPKQAPPKAGSLKG